MTNQNENNTEAHNPFKAEEKHSDFPEFFQGMACAYEDCARIVETMKANLPPEFEFMGDGMEILILGFRGKIGELEIAVLGHMAQASRPTVETEQ